MDANQLLYYLRGLFEHVTFPTEEQIRSIRTQILMTKPVEAQLIPVEVRNPIGSPSGKHGGCGCGGSPA